MNIAISFNNLYLQLFNKIILLISQLNLAARVRDSWRDKEESAIRIFSTWLHFGQSHDFQCFIPEKCFAWNTATNNNCSIMNKVSHRYVSLGDVNPIFTALGC